MRVRVALLALLPLLVPGTAGAHAILVDSQPPARGSVGAGPVGITLRFNSRIDAGRSRLMLRGAGQDQVLPLAPGGTEDVLRTQAEVTPGEYVLRWQVLAVDGHITRGDVPFTVRGAGAPPGAGQADPVDASKGPAGPVPLRTP